MESGDNHHGFNHNYGLLRFRSAPGSHLLSDMTNAGGGDAPAATKGSSSDGIERDNFGSGFMNYSGDDNSESEGRSLRMFDDRSQSVTSLMMATTEVAYRDSPHLYSGLPPQYPRHSGNSSCTAGVKGSSGLVSTAGINNNRMKPIGSGLMRQSSSPPRPFSDITASNGYAVLNGMGNYRIGGQMDEELSPSENRLKNQNSFSSRPTSLGILPRISELGREDYGAHSPDDTKGGITSVDNRLGGHGCLFSPWNDPASHFSQNIFGLKKEGENGVKKSFDSQNGEIGHHVSLLSHHLSLPKASSGMVALHFPDSVPCKIRAKRGCATHPRSIAERVRRTRISERMRKLQELVPNMDKQTNTADMLDLAVEYIKNLQKQFRILSEHRANCKCLSMQ